MHISNGVFPIQAAVVAYVLAMGAVFLIGRKIKIAEIPKIGLMASAFYLASLLFSPFAGTSIPLGLFGQTLPAVFAAAQQPLKGPVPKVIKLDSQGQEYVCVLGGLPETTTMRSGLISLAPQKSVGKHNTENYEELVIILDGQAEMRITDGERLRLAKGFAAYCPAHTEHDVLNIGNETLRYIYVVAEAKK